jgi:hypothetical protein
MDFWINLSRINSTQSFSGRKLCLNAALCIVSSSPLFQIATRPAPELFRQNQYSQENGQARQPPIFSRADSLKFLLEQLVILEFPDFQMQIEM